MANSTRRRAQLQAERLAAARKARNRRLAITLVGVVVGLAIIIALVWWGLSRSQTPTPTTNSTGSGSGQITPPNAFSDIRNDNTLVGIGANPAAIDPEHTVTIFGDYQCSACYLQEEALKPVLQEAGASTQVRLEMVNRDFLDEDPSHDSWSRPASMASACADTVGSFLPYHLAIYDHYGSLDETVLRETIPSDIGLSGDQLTQFQKCYDEELTLSFVDTMEKTAAAYMYNNGFTGTPVFLLDGEPVQLSSWFSDDGSRLDLDKVRAAWGLI
ncbi:MAG: DsbA family protein [Propionibacteriaceae bacterium]|jgi:protein-disulfide isomerase|nr:DsbA family protein [Propionibacteriaceae bacterium]